MCSGHLAGVDDRAGLVLDGLLLWSDRAPVFRALVAIVGARQSHSPVLPDAALPGRALSDREHLRLSEPKDLLSFLPGLVLALRTVGADSNRTAGRGYSVCVRATHEQRRQSHPRDRNQHTETAEFTATR